MAGRALLRTLFDEECAECGDALKLIGRSKLAF
jgi:hypothetical protein